MAPPNELNFSLDIFFQEHSINKYINIKYHSEMSKKTLTWKPWTKIEKKLFLDLINIWYMYGISSHILDFPKIKKTVVLSN